jgi:probable addiction module antidote protein
MPKRTSDYNSWRLKKLADPRLAAGYLNAAIADSKEMFLKALRNVAQAQQVASVAQKAGVKRESLYRALSGKGNPTLDTLQSVLDAMGLKIAITAKRPPSSAGAGRTASRRSTTINQ